MKIELHELPRCTIEEFADKYNLKMIVRERSKRFWWHGEDEKYYASFERCEIKIGGGMLSGNFGNGKTPELAIKNYAKEISEQTIVLNAFRENRTEISVPILVEK